MSPREEWLGCWQGYKRQRKREYAKIDDQSGFPLSKPLGAKAGFVPATFCRCKDDNELDSVHFRFQSNNSAANQ